MIYFKSQQSLQNNLNIVSKFGFVLILKPFFNFSYDFLVSSVSRQIITPRAIMLDAISAIKIPTAVAIKSSFFNFFYGHQNSASKNRDKTKYNNYSSKFFTENVYSSKRECQDKKAYYLSQIPKVFITKTLHAFLTFLCLLVKNIIVIATNGSAKTPNIAPTSKILLIFSTNSINLLNLMSKFNPLFCFLQAFLQATKKAFGFIFLFFTDFSKSYHQLKEEEKKALEEFKRKNNQ